MTPWREYKKKTEYPDLKENIEVDVAIIGGGITGVLNAYMLAKSGKKVALVEKRQLCGYATMDTTAFITKVIDSDLQEIASIFSDSTAKAVWQSGQAAIEEFERIITDEKIDCEFVRCPNFIYAGTEKEFEELEDEHGLYKKFRIEAELADNPADLPFLNHGHMKIPDQAKFHPTKFIYSIAEKAVEAGADIYENTCANKISGIDPVEISTTGGTLKARDVLIATYEPLTNEKTHLKKGMYRSYVIEARMPKGIFEEALYEDNGNPYHYFRIDPEDKHDRIIFGGEDHRDIFGKIARDKSFKALLKDFAEIFDGYSYEIINRWNGPILEPSDGLPLIGRIKPHYYVATAFSGNGMTYSMISSMIVRDLINGKTNPWASAYDPKRKLLHPKRLAAKAKDYTEEFFNGIFKNMLSG